MSRASNAWTWLVWSAFILAAASVLAMLYFHSLMDQRVSAVESNQIELIRRDLHAIDEKLDTVLGAAKAIQVARHYVEESREIRSQYFERLGLSGADSEDRVETERQALAALWNYKGFSSLSELDRSYFNHAHLELVSSLNAVESLSAQKYLVVYEMEEGHSLGVIKSLQYAINELLDRLDGQE